MIGKKSVVIIGLLFGVSIFYAYKQTEHADQDEVMAKGQQIYPVPIPADLSFAGEVVPLAKYGIKERLDRELTVNTYWQSSTILILKRTKKYFEIIEPILAKNGIPDDFKYLAVAESGLQNVMSNKGAQGVWQMMKATGRSYGLEVRDGVDERLSLELSTEAACIYLREAYNKFGTWSLAAAAYNRGMSGISRDLAFQYVDDYYDVNLNSETARYMFRILAFKTIIENQESYGFHIQPKDYYADPLYSTITVDTTITDLAQYAQQLGTNYQVLRGLNPWITSRKELKVFSKTYTIKAPLMK